MCQTSFKQADVGLDDSHCLISKSFRWRDHKRKGYSHRSKLGRKQRRDRWQGIGLRLYKNTIYEEFISQRWDTRASLVLASLQAIIVHLSGVLPERCIITMNGNDKGPKSTHLWFALTLRLRHCNIDSQHPIVYHQAVNPTKYIS